METQTGMEIMDREECLRLLAGHSFGRLAVNLRSEIPIIRPVNYVFDERTESILFRTDSGAKFRGVILSPKAAFEIDGIDPARRTGWSVIVTGSVERVTNFHELERFGRLGLDPWAPGERPNWVRIRVWRISGRRISRDDDEPIFVWDETIAAP